jgi:hypothetical protein
VLRRLGTIGLLIFVAVCVVWAYAQPVGEPSSPQDSDDHESSAALIVYYLHGDRRCATCEGIEAGARRVLAVSFDAEVRSGALELITRNTDRAEHAHFTEDFGLVSSSLVVSTPDGTSFRVLDRVWQLVGNDAAFDEYVAAGVRSALDGGW